MLLSRMKLAFLGDSGQSRGASWPGNGQYESGSLTILKDHDDTGETLGVLSDLVKKKKLPESFYLLRQMIH